jgi:hypothetical protein
MSDKELWQAAWRELELTTDPYPTWKKKGFPATSHWAKAKALGEQIGAVTPPPVPPTGKRVAANKAAVQAAIDSAVDGDVLLIEPGNVSGQIHVWSGLTRKFQIRGLDPTNPPVFTGGEANGLYAFHCEAPVTFGPDITVTNPNGYGVGYRAGTANLNGGRVTGVKFIRNGISGLYQGTQPGFTHYNFVVEKCIALANGQRLDLDPHEPNGDGEHSYYIGGGEGTTDGALVVDCLSEDQLNGQAFQGGGGLRNSKYLRCTARRIKVTPGMPASSFAGFGLFSSYMGTAGIVYDECLVEDCGGYGYKAVGGATGIVKNSKALRCGLGFSYGLVDGGGNS